MIELKLNEQEAKCLTDLLESALSDLGFEIADTDRMDFREHLKEDRRVLRGILEALKGSGDDGG
jgi:hypothetical protein